MQLPQNSIFGTIWPLVQILKVIGRENWPNVSSQESSCHYLSDLAQLSLYLGYCGKYPYMWGYDHLLSNSGEENLATCWLTDLLPGIILSWSRIIIVSRDHTQLSLYLRNWSKYQYMIMCWSTLTKICWHVCLGNLSAGIILSQSSTIILSTKLGELSLNYLNWNPACVGQKVDCLL